MNEVIPKLFLGIDAVQLRPNLEVDENVFLPEFPVEKLVEDFCKEDYKSAFFLLMDNDIDPKNFTEFTNQDLPVLKTEFIKIIQKYLIEEKKLIELFNTLKMFKKLKLFGTCFHILESQSNQFEHIKKIWKILYEVCEEISDKDLQILKQKVPKNSSIQSAEDWFCWALNENIYCRTDLSGLETIFKEYPNCLNLIKNFNDFELYPMKVPSSSLSCGIALILNYDKFDKNTGLQQRHNSKKDVEALKELWKNFGFESKCYSNLSHSDTFKEMKDCALADHSSFDAFVCCILSHGLSNSVYSSDGKLINITDLIYPIVNDCSTLINKPKLFFIQACQGTYIHQGAGKQTFNIDTEETPHIKSTSATTPPIIIDTLISQSTIDGYVSFRDDKGSWFFQTFCKIMVKYGNSYTIDEILRKVNYDISRLEANFGPSGPTAALQIPVCTTNLRKKLIFKKRSN